MSTRAEREAGILPGGEVNGRQLAVILGVPHGTVKRWRREGLPGRKSGRDLWIVPDEARAWIATRFDGRVPIGMNRISQVYVAHRLDDGAVKVGWTSDIVRRLAELRKKSHAFVELVACLPGDKPRELRVHEMLKPYLIGEEWYACPIATAVSALRAAA